jgi:hypothetical protein
MGAAKLRIACRLTPLRVAVTVAFWVVLTVPLVAAKVALLWPEGTATLAGTESIPLLLARATVARLVAVLPKVTVQVVEELLPKAAGAHASEVSCEGAFPVAVSVNDRETPFKVAVSSAV